MGTRNKQMTRDIVKTTGGAKIGWVNASWPFATLTATREKLDLNASVIGRYTFSPAQITSIESYSIFPVLGTGIRIKHNVASYPGRIEFACFGNPDALITSIRETGFAPCGSPNPMLANRGIAVRWQAVVITVLLWNILLLADMYLHLERGTKAKPGVFSFLAVLFLFTGSVALPRSQRLQRFVLKPGRSPSEIRAWLFLIDAVSAIMLVFMGSALISGVM
ncbi:MAG: hypothetical protein WC889_10775 [Myxococcota bacterium]|jgi:hypothetical protein